MMTQRKRRLWFTTGLAAGVVFSALAFWQIRTIAWFFQGGYIPRHVLTVVSPDGKHSIQITERVVFPADELFDPSHVVIVALVDYGSGRVVERQRVKIGEDSGFGEASIEWTPAAARVRGLDRRHERLLVFNRNG